MSHHWGENFCKVNSLFLSEAFCNQPGFVSLWLNIWYSLLNLVNPFAPYYPLVCWSFNEIPGVILFQRHHFLIYSLDPFFYLITVDSF
ncbi:hypothetical protein WN944_026529 [Citrus x changshan-huyou]|uniref:Uncharacterized protein n=1 Tax=Citrus x changshan-huyou TaxID=2935761 RepID=A0AAP0LSN7_9ROSI